MAVNDEQLSRLIRALEKLAGTTKGSSDTGASPLDAAAQKTSIDKAVGESSITDLGAEIKDQKTLLDILKKQADTKEAMEERQASMARHIQNQNTVEQNILERRLDAKNKDIEYQQQMLTANVEALEKKREEEELSEEQNAELEKRINMLKLQSRELAKQAKFNKDTAASLKGVDGLVNSIVGKATGGLLSTGGYEKSIFGQIEKAAGGDMKKMLSATGQAIGQVGVSLARAVHPAALFSAAMGKLTSNTIDLIKTQNELLANFTKATGLTGEYHEMIVRTNVENAEFHVLMEDGSKAMQALLSNFRAFSNMSDDVQDNLKNVVVQLEAIGVSGETSTKLLNESRTALNMSTDDAIQMTLDLTKASRELYGQQDRLQKEFQASLSTLAVYGARAKDVFLGVAAAAKVAGMETSDLLGITEQFDTFQGAAEAVSGLNAILGGQYLNSLQMVNATEEERIRMLVGSMEAANISFGSLSKFNQKAIAAKLGITDMAKANQLLGMSTAELDAQMSQVEGLSLDPEEMKALAQQTASFSAKWNSALERFTIAVGPLMDLVGGLLDGFIAFVDYFKDDPWVPLTLGLAAAIGSMFLFAKMTAMATGAMFGKMTGMAGLTAELAANNALRIKQIGLTHGSTAAQTAGAAADTARTATRVGEAGATAAQTAAKAGNTAAQGLETAADVAGDVVRKQGILSRMSERLGTLSGIGAKISSAAASGVEAAAELGSQGVRAFSIVQMGLATAAKYGMAAASYVLTGAFNILGLASASLGVKLLLATGLLLALAAVVLVPMFSPPLYIGLGMLAGAMLALALASKVGAGPIAASAGAMLALAKATAGAAWSMTLLAGAMGLVALSLASIAITAAATAISVALLAGATSLLGLGAMFAGPGLLAFSAGILALDAALLAFAVTSIVTLPILWSIASGMLAAGLGAVMMAEAFRDQDTSLGSLITNLEKIDKITQKAFSVDLLDLGTLSLMVNEFERLVDAVNKIDPIKMLTLSLTMKEVGSFTPDTAEVLSEIRGVIDATAASTPEQTTAVADMLRATSKLAEQAAAAETGIFEQIGNMISAASGDKEAKTASAGEQANSGRPINLYMDRNGRKAFAKGIIDELKPEVLGKLFSITKSN